MRTSTRGLVVVAVIAAWARPAAADDITSYRAQIGTPTEDVTARVAAPVKRVVARDRQLVHKGDPLVTLDDAGLRARIGNLTIELARRRAAATTAEADLAHAAPSERDHARAGADLARARVSQVGAMLDLARLDLASASVTAAQDGTLAWQPPAAGQQVERGQVLGQVVDVAHAWVDAYVTESQAARVKVGQRADVAIDLVGQGTLGGQRTVTLRGTVALVDLDGAALVHAALDAGSDAVRAGVRVQIQLVAPRGPGVWPGTAATARIHVP